MEYRGRSAGHAVAHRLEGEQPETRRCCDNRHASGEEWRPHWKSRERDHIGWPDAWSRRRRAGGETEILAPAVLTDMNSNATSGTLFNWTQGIYALHAFSLLTGIIGAATVVGAFLTGWPSLIAVILNYVKRSEVRGTWLESHFRWQIRTFWYGLLWVSLCLLFVVVTFGLGIIVAWLPLVVVSLWFIYRIMRGWLALRDPRPMYGRFS